MTQHNYAQYNHQGKNSETENQYKTGLELLKKQQPKEAIPALNKAVKLDASFDEAKSSLEDAVEALNWSNWYFCRNCGKFVRPEKGYPWVEIDDFCPRCGNSVPTQKEVLISHVEIAVKLVFFGIFPLLVFIFCGMPYWQHVYPYSVKIVWSRIIDGIITAANFTLIVHVFLVMINDPWAYSLTSIKNLLNPLQNSPLYFLAEISILFLLMYLYFLLILTPILTIHKKGLWKDRKHQKSIILYTSMFVGLIVIIRVASGAAY